MKKLLIFGTTMMVVCMTSVAQPPQSFKYQTVVRDYSGEIIQNQTIGVLISIHNSIPTGNIIYQETFSPSTNAFGLVNLEIGNGTPTIGAFSAIDWGSGSKFMEVEIDPNGGSNYTSTGTSELLSVPYALYANQSADSHWGINGSDVYYNNGSVGIGTISPSRKIEINGNNSETGLRVAWGSNYPSVYGDILNNISGGLILNSNAGGGSWADMSLQTNGTTRMFIESAGNVGIGTTSPDNRLVVKSPGGGDVLKILSNTDNTLAKFRQTGNGSGSLYLYDGSNNNTVFLYGLGTSFINSGPLGLGTSSVSNAKLQLEGSGTYDAIMKMNNTSTNGASFFMGSTNYAWGGGANQDLFVMGYGAPASANIDFCINSDGNIGIGTNSPTAPLHVSSNSTYAIYGSNTSLTGRGIHGDSDYGYGVVGHSDFGHAAYFLGEVYVAGTFGKASGSFVIDHPLDPENKLLRHNFVESPENLLIYRGKVKLDSNGEANVRMPEYFMALTMENEATVQLTPVGKSRNQIKYELCYEWSNSFSEFTIYGEPGRQVSWMVLADRDDPVIHQFARPVEEEKSDANKLCKKGKLIYPKAYGYPETMGRDYEMKKNLKTDLK